MKDDYLSFESYSDSYTVEDWNEFVEKVFARYFSDESVLHENIEALRTEVVNYASVSKSPEHHRLMERTIDYYNMLKSMSASKFNGIFANHLREISETDMRWTSYALMQSSTAEYSKRDSITAKFKAIEDILEGCFKDRFKLLFHVASEIEGKADKYKKDLDFGQCVAQFPGSVKMFSLYLCDPVLLVSTSQWRNIAAHRNFEIRNDYIKMNYGKNSVKGIHLSYDQLNRIIEWMKHSYYSLRLSQVIIYLANPSIYEVFRERKEELSLRFEPWVLQIVHNLQIVGFPFVRAVGNESTLDIQLKNRKGAGLKESIIHASQSLDQLSMAIYTDEFARERYKTARVSILSNDGHILASAEIDVGKMCALSEESSIGQYERRMIELVRFQVDNNTL